MKVPLLDLKQQLSYLREDILEAVTRVIDSTIYIQGPEVASLEQEVAAYCGVENGVGVSSGTDALLVSLMALGIGPGDQVLTTPYSFFATMGVVLRLGATPVFVDIDPISFNIDPVSMVEVLARDSERKIKAILPVHLYGQCADMVAIMKLANQYALPVIEDAAQAIGAECPMSDKGGGMNGQWKKAGSMGLAGCFSFFPSKNLGGMGDGGMVVTNDCAYADKIRILLNHGASPKYYHGQVGGNFRLDPIQATVLRIKLTYLEQWHRARRENADRYNTFFAESGLVQNNFLVLPQAVYQEKKLDNSAMNGVGENYHIYNQYVLRVSRRDALITWLRSQDIGCEVYYPLALHQQKCLGASFPVLSFPQAEKAAAETIALPIYPELTADMQAYVVEKIAEFYRQ
ncbi:MAG: DegT/DnrJ/EryC1/StrS family aminotransferase [Deltaproteobacteria bacterium]|nr:DegT/DnrJ/EryC1/StrS family aminotransferase [Deltaproteobacteria bacterium]